MVWLTLLTKEKKYLIQDKVKVRINRIHIEEDAGKLVHLEDEPYSLIDYNRCGVPLIEIVTEPDLRSPAEAAEFMRQLKGILEYADISDCRMEQGSIRCDANISIRPVGQEEYGTKVEIKNINSFREVQKALEKEEKRQKVNFVKTRTHRQTNAAGDRKRRATGRMPPHGVWSIGFNQHDTGPAVR